MKKKVGFETIHLLENLKLQPLTSEFVQGNYQSFNEKDLAKIYGIFYESTSEVAKIIVNRGHDAKEKCNFLLNFSLFS